MTADKGLHPKSFFCAIDSPVDLASGQQIQGAEPGGNPGKKGRNSRHPLLAVNVRSVIDGYLGKFSSKMRILIAKAVRE